MARLDTGWHVHPKILGLGLGAMGLHAWSISYCDHALSDGFIPMGAWPALPGVTAAVTKLRAVGLWEVCAGGYRLHDYMDYNRSKAEVDRIKAAMAANGRAGGQASAQAKAQANGKQIVHQKLKQKPTPGPGPGLITPSSSSVSPSPVNTGELVPIARGGAQGAALLAEHERRLEQERAATTTNKNSLKDER